jgi:hypothetical protein
MKKGTPEIKSAGHLAFGPDGVLFVGDAKSATVFAIATGDTDGDANEARHDLQGLNAKLEELLKQKDIAVNDLAVNPSSGTAYLSVSCGADMTPAIVKVLPGGKLEAMSTSNIDFSMVQLPNAPVDALQGEGRRRRNPRDEAITDLVFFDGRMLVSGRTGDESGYSRVRELIFPFEEADQGTNVEIYHGNHGRFEDNAVVRTFVPFNIGGEPQLLAGFTCTPLVKFPIKSLGSGQQVKGTTVAELGNRNVPLDMIVYQKDGKDFLLMTNSVRGVMKISTDDIERSEGITDRVAGIAGQSYETIESLENVVQLDRLNDGNAVVIMATDNGLDMHTIALP